MTKYDKFFNEFKNFSDHETIADFDTQSKIALFKVYVEVMSRPKSANNQSQSRNRNNQRNNQATDKQIGLLRSFIKQGFLEDQTLDGLSKKAASDLIQEGYSNKNSGTKINSQDDQEDQGEFAGSYDHGDSTDGGFLF